MTTIWPISRDALEKVANGEHILFKSPQGDRIVLGLSDGPNGNFKPLEWEIEDGWKK